MFLGVKLATYTVEYAIYKSKFIGNGTEICTV